MTATGQGESAPPAPPEGGGEQQQAAPETTAPAGLDRVYERMDQMAEGQRQIVESLTQFMTPEEEEEAEFDPANFYDEEGGMTEEGAQALISDMVNQKVEAALAPREAAALIRDRDDRYEALKDDYPELQDEKIAGPVLNAAIAWANSHNPKLIDRPEFVDIIEAFYARSQMATLREQQAAQQPRVVLESASGARQQQPQDTKDWGDAIVKAAERLRPQI